MVSAKDFLDKYSGASLFKHRDELRSLQTVVSDGERMVSEASILKVEAMLIHAAKSKLKKTQRELIDAQFTQMAALSLDENLVHSGLAKWAKSFLQ